MQEQLNRAFEELGQLLTRPGYIINNPWFKGNILCRSWSTWNESGIFFTVDRYPSGVISHIKIDQFEFDLTTIEEFDDEDRGVEYGIMYTVKDTNTNTIINFDKIQYQ